MKILQEATLDDEFAAAMKRIQGSITKLEKLIDTHGYKAFTDSQRNQVRQAKIDFEVMFAAMSK